MALTCHDQNRPPPRDGGRAPPMRTFVDRALGGEVLRDQNPVKIDQKPAKPRPAAGYWSGGIGRSDASSEASGDGRRDSGFVTPGATFVVLSRTLCAISATLRLLASLTTHTCLIRSVRVVAAFGLGHGRAIWSGLGRITRAEPGAVALLIGWLQLPSRAQAVSTECRLRCSPCR